MYRYGAMVINLTRRGYCDAGPCVYVLTVCGYVFVYLCVRSPISQYNFVKCGTIVTKLYIEITVIYAESREKHSENILVGVCTGTLKRGS